MMEDESRTRRRTLVAAIGAGVVVVVILVVIVVFGFVSPPTFPHLADQPNTGIPGRVAYLRYEARERGPCIYVVDASGGPERSVGCDLVTHDLAWSTDGHLLALGYDTAGLEAAVLDPATGEVVGFFEDADALEEYQRINRSRHPEAGRLITDRDAHRNTSVSVLPPGGGPVEIVSAEGPRDYSFFSALWSPDGRWVLIMDSSSRLLVVSADGSQGPYVLAERANSPAWFVPGRSEFTVDVSERG